MLDQLNKLKTRKISFLIILAIYVLALTGGFLVFSVVNSLHTILSTLLANLTATLIVWFFGVVFNNSSIYDPYWSVAPIVIIILWASVKQVSLHPVDILLLTAIIIWGIRLTANWAVRWQGLKHQDWRYTYYKNKSLKAWFWTNLFGINIMPTIIVFLSLVPAYLSLGHTGIPNKLTAAGFMTCITAVAIQLFSDKQMDIFKKNCTDKKHIDKGLWKYSRHPNYFGEVLFWWGVWLMQLGIIPQLWFTIIGPIAMTLLFMFISIPLMENHIIITRPSYNNYRNNVSMLIPWFRINKSEQQLPSS